MLIFGKKKLQRVSSFANCTRNMISHKDQYMLKAPLSPFTTLYISLLLGVAGGPKKRKDWNIR